MKSIPCPALVLALAFALMATTGVAQHAGDLVVLDTQQNHVLTGPRGGTLSTLAVLSSLNSYGPMAAGPGDGSALVLALAQTAVPRTYLWRVDTSGVNTLSSFFIFPMSAAAIDLDDAGDLVLLTRWNGSQNGLYRAPLVGATTLSPVALWPKGAAEPVAFAEQVDTGNWWILDQAGVLHLVARGGGAVLSLAHTSTTSLRAGNLAEDPLTGDVLLASEWSLLRYEPVISKLTTVFFPGMPQGGTEALGLHFDQQSRGWLFSNWMGFGPGMFGFVHEFDAKLSTIVRSTALGTPRRPDNLLAAWGRAFTAASAPEVGKTYALKLLSPADASQAYRAALAFSSRPGLATPLGPIPLTPDSLFFLSLSGAPIFRGFAGALDPRGEAALAIDIPNLGALRGLRCVAAAVAADAQGLRRILGPHGFTLR
ncbi:MAG: hypothetical protein JXQ29_05420 [Planctomycetes bacterium]|nr:hypothetical protein [Planctomycetota bacterium]